MSKIDIIRIQPVTPDTFQFTFKPKREYPEVVKAIFEAEYKMHSEQMKDKGAVIFNGVKTLVEDIRQNNDLVFISMREADFKEELGLQECRKRFPSRESEFRGDSLAVTGVLLTKDDKIICGVRSKKVSAFQNMLCSFGGGLDMAFEEKFTMKDVQQKIMAEMNEEIGFSPSQIVKERFVAFFREQVNASWAIYFFIFTVGVDLTSDEILELFRKNKDLEHSNLWVADSRKADSLLVEKYHANQAHASLYVWAKYRSIC